MNSASTVLLAGAGGGFDIFSGLPLYFALRAQGKRVVLANLSFSSLGPGAGRRVTPDCVEVTADSQARSDYFPELYLSQWFREASSSHRFSQQLKASMATTNPPAELAAASCTSTR